MKRFEFRLSSLLDFRNYHELLARKETATAYRDVKSSQEVIETLKERHINKANEFDQRILKGIKAKDLHLYNQYLDMINYNIAKEKQNKQKLQMILNKKIAELTKKSIDKKVIEKLKEKQETEYMDELRKSDQETIDEVVSLKKARELNYESQSKS